MKLVAFRLFWEPSTSPEGPCPIHITVPPPTYVCAGARFTEPAAHQYGTGWRHKPCFLSYGTGCTDHDRQQLGPVPQQVGLHRSLEQSELRFSDLIRGARAVKTGVVLRLNPLHMLVTHLGQQVCVSRNCTRTHSGVPDNDCTSINK